MVMLLLLIMMITIIVIKAVNDNVKAWDDVDVEDDVNVDGDDVEDDVDVDRGGSLLPSTVCGQTHTMGGVPPHC